MTHDKHDETTDATVCLCPAWPVPHLWSIATPGHYCQPVSVTR